ncbi:MAG: hypothetical protein JXX14_25335, partial [Deltaproteobacteria bacterium]|nr:hypothetical protein [Deltaproteobacteria bacterium]
MKIHLTAPFPMSGTALGYSLTCALLFLACQSTPRAHKQPDAAPAPIHKPSLTSTRQTAAPSPALFREMIWSFDKTG